MSKNIKDYSRLFGSIIYFIAGISLLLLNIRLAGFYNDPINNFQNFPRLIYAIGFTFLGFSLIAFRASQSNHDKGAFPSYLTSYLITLILTGSLVFGFFHIFDSTSNYIYYFLAGPIAFILGYHADEAKNNPIGLFSLLKQAFH